MNEPIDDGGPAFPMGITEGVHRSHPQQAEVEFFLNYIIEAMNSHPQQAEMELFIDSIIEDGYTVDRVVDGGNITTGPFERAELLEIILSVDEITLWLKHNLLASPAWVFLVLGNEPGVLIADYSGRIATEPGTRYHEKYA